MRVTEGRSFANVGKCRGCAWNNICKDPDLLYGCSRGVQKEDLLQRLQAVLDFRLQLREIERRRGA